MNDSKPSTSECICGNCEEHRAFSLAFQQGDEKELQEWKKEYQLGETLLLEEELTLEEKEFLES